MKLTQNFVTFAQKLISEPNTEHEVTETHKKKVIELLWAIPSFYFQS